MVLTSVIGFWEDVATTSMSKHLLDTGKHSWTISLGFGEKSKLCKKKRSKIYMIYRTSHAVSYISAKCIESIECRTENKPIMS